MDALRERVQRALEGLSVPDDAHPDVKEVAQEAIEVLHVRKAVHGRRWRPSTAEAAALWILGEVCGSAEMFDLSKVAMESD